MPFVSAKADKTNKTVTYVDDKGGITIRKGGSVAWRNNNMGNQVKGAFPTRHGAIGDDGHFAIFPDYTTGRAAEQDLITGPTYKSKSVADAVAALTPNVEALHGI
jgi:hypothetical protein